MNTFKLTRKNLLMLKAMSESFDKINKIVFAEESHVFPYPDDQKISDIKRVLTEFGEEFGHG